MRLEPFIRVDATPFTTSREEVLHDWGTPLRTCRNGVGLNELDFGSVVFRFQDGGRLEEVTMQAPVVDLGAVAVPFAVLRSFVQEHDASWFERAGFIVSPKFGFAFDPGCHAWVTALAEHCLDSWRAL